MICGLVFKVITGHRQNAENGQNYGIFHTNVPVDDPGIYPMKDKQRLLENPQLDTRYRNDYHGNPRLLENLLSPRSGSGQHDNQIIVQRGPIPQSDHLIRQNTTTPVKDPYTRLVTSPTAYISKSDVRSPPRPKG